MGKIIRRSFWFQIAIFVIVASWVTVSRPDWIVDPPLKNLAVITTPAIVQPTQIATTPSQSPSKPQDQGNPLPSPTPAPVQPTPNPIPDSVPTSGQLIPEPTTPPNPNSVLLYGNHVYC